MLSPTTHRIPTLAVLLALLVAFTGVVAPTAAADQADEPQLHVTSHVDATAGGRIAIEGSGFTAVDDEAGDLHVVVAAIDEQRHGEGAPPSSWEAVARVLVTTSPTGPSQVAWTDGGSFSAVVVVGPLGAPPEGHRWSVLTWSAGDPVPAWEQVAEVTVDVADEPADHDPSDGSPSDDDGSSGDDASDDDAADTAEEEGHDDAAAEDGDAAAIDTPAAADDEGTGSDQPPAPVEVVEDSAGDAAAPQATGGSEPPVQSVPGTELDPLVVSEQVTARSVTGGTLSWGVKASFRNYIAGPIAQGQVATSGGASSVSDGFQFAPASGTAADGALDARAPGTVHFTGHDDGSGPLLDMTLSNPRVRIDASTAVLLVDARSREFTGFEVDPDDPPGFIEARGVAMVALDVASGAVDTSGGQVVLADVPATLTADGAEAFGGFYAAGEVMDPVSVTIDVAAPPEPDPTPEAADDTDQGADADDDGEAPAADADDDSDGDGGGGGDDDEDEDAPADGPGGAPDTGGSGPGSGSGPSGGGGSSSSAPGSLARTGGGLGALLVAGAALVAGASLVIAERRSSRARRRDRGPRGWTRPLGGPASRAAGTLGVAAVVLIGLGAPAQAAGTLEVEPVDDLADGQVVTVSGSGYDTSKGIYVAFCVVPEPGETPTPCGGGIDVTGEANASVWISDDPPPYGSDLVEGFGPDGTFEVQIPVAASIGEVDCGDGACAIVTRADHTRTSDRSADVIVPVDVAAEAGDVATAEAADDEPTAVDETTTDAATTDEEPVAVETDTDPVATAQTGTSASLTPWLILAGGAVIAAALATLVVARRRRT